mgnify:CR=1 FL=1
MEVSLFSRRARFPCSRGYETISNAGWETQPLQTCNRWRGRLPAARVPNPMFWADERAPPTAIDSPHRAAYNVLCAFDKFCNSNLKIDPDFAVPRGGSRHPPSIFSALPL